MARATPRKRAWSARCNRARAWSVGGATGPHREADCRARACGSRSRARSRARSCACASTRSMRARRSITRTASGTCIRDDRPTPCSPRSARSRRSRRSRWLSARGHGSRTHSASSRCSRSRRTRCRARRRGRTRTYRRCSRASRFSVRAAAMRCRSMRGAGAVVACHGSTYPARIRAACGSCS